VHARIAGLMALMATAEVFEKEDLAGKVIPAMSICLVDREKYVGLCASPALFST
jgi:SCY1-like protein 1